ncbi:MAG: phosphoribosylaminoimidazolesuccinocarboxamide synthase [Planctomycetes bacterium]|nr:phosphoribosylaminoimidazolesuccinocarboxamide synthase [Planctomycetota bacterium]
MSPPDPWSVPGVEPSARGKVRDIYDLGHRLLLVGTDRISAFDRILPQAIPEKGAILTSLSRFWFDHLAEICPSHLVSTSAADLPEPFRAAARRWGPRFMLVEKLQMIPVECVARGYLAGSGWKEYKRSGTVCGIGLPAGLVQAAELEHPIFTPATKATDGHDENISREQAEALLGATLVDKLERLTLEIYEFGRTFARERGVILADTKLEFGLRGRNLVPILADEVLTPDSSRYWPADVYKPGGSPPSFDKQFVRDHLTSIGWSGDGPVPELPAHVVEGTVHRYREIFERLTGEPWGRRGGA